MPKEREPPTKTRLVPLALAFARARGVELEPLLLRHRLPAGAEQLPELEIGLKELRELFDDLAVELSDPLLGLRLVTHAEKKSYGIAELAARSSPTFRDALERMVRYGALVNDSIGFSLEESGAEVVFRQRL